MTTELTTFNGTRNITGAPTTEDWQVRAIKVRDMLVKSGDINVKYLLPSEIHTLFEYEFDDKKLMLYWFLWATGTRIGEALAVKVSDIVFDESKSDKPLNYVNIKNAKVWAGKKKYRQLEINDFMVKKLKIYIETNKLKPHNFLFKVKYRAAFNWIEKTQKKAELDGVKFPLKITPHVIRHSFAMYMYYHNVDKQIISKLLGHKQISSTEIYTDINAIEAINMRNIEF